MCCITILVDLNYRVGTSLTHCLAKYSPPKRLHTSFSLNLLQLWLGHVFAVTSVMSQEQFLWIVAFIFMMRTIVLTLTLIHLFLMKHQTVHNNNKVFKILLISNYDFNSIAIVQCVFLKCFQFQFHSYNEVILTCTFTLLVKILVYILSRHFLYFLGLKQKLCAITVSIWTVFV